MLFYWTNFWCWKRDAVIADLNPRRNIHSFNTEEIQNVEDDASTLLFNWIFHYFKPAANEGSQYR